MDVSFKSCSAHNICYLLIDNSIFQKPILHPIMIHLQTIVHIKFVQTDVGYCIIATCPISSASDCLTPSYSGNR